MSDTLVSLFAAISIPPTIGAGGPVYSVAPLNADNMYLVGKDHEQNACLLIAHSDGPGPVRAPIRLENIEVQFAVRCQLRQRALPERPGVFTVVRCRVSERDTVHLFLSICHTMMRLLGDRPVGADIAFVVHRLSAMFAKMRRVPTRSASGLFGELFVIWRSNDPVEALQAWRTDEATRFDFNVGNVRMDVKTAMTRQRSHVFSYDQCNPSAKAVAFVASMFAERASSGVTLQVIVREIEERVQHEADLVFKLHEVLAATLGESMSAGLATGFDAQLAESSLRFFSTADVHAIRGKLPTGVTEVHFRSDLSDVTPLLPQELIARDPALWALMPRSDG